MRRIIAVRPIHLVGGAICTTARALSNGQCCLGRRWRRRCRQNECPGPFGRRPMPSSAYRTYDAARTLHCCALIVDALLRCLETWEVAAGDHHLDRMVDLLLAWVLLLTTSTLSACCTASFLAAGGMAQCRRFPCSALSDLHASSRIRASNKEPEGNRKLHKQSSQLRQASQIHQIR